MKMLHRIRCIRMFYVRSNEHSCFRINLIYLVIINENRQFQRCIFQLYILEQDRDQTFDNRLNLQVVVCLLHFLQVYVLW